MEDFDINKPPTKTVTYTQLVHTGFCKACNQPICELASVPRQEFDGSGKGYEWLRLYIQRKLLDSGVIPADEANPANPFGIASQIHHRAMRQGDSLSMRGQFLCIETADDGIKHAIACPPPPITATRFSLQAFVKLERGEEHDEDL